MKINVFTIIVCCLFIISCKKNADTIAEHAYIINNNIATSDTSWQLLWHDEFNYEGLPNIYKWSYETGFVRNDEPQYYEAGRIQNSHVTNGVLKIKALYNTKTGRITSASIITKNKMNFLYGRIEVRAKMPMGSGAWPAIWLLGINRDKVSWPRCGEIDIMEWFAQYPQYVVGSIYTIGTSGKDTSLVTPYIPKDSATLSTKFHIYAIEWDSTQIKYFYDDKKYAVYEASDLTTAEWRPFTKPMYLLLNLAMGVSGGTIDYNKFPFVYEVDYVRYYKKK